MHSQLATYTPATWFPAPDELEKGRTPISPIALCRFPAIWTRDARCGFPLIGRRAPSADGNVAEHLTRRRVPLCHVVSVAPHGHGVSTARKLVAGRRFPGGRAEEMPAATAVCPSGRERRRRSEERKRDGHIRLHHPLGCGDVRRHRSVAAESTTALGIYLDLHIKAGAALRSQRPDRPFAVSRTVSFPPSLGAPPSSGFLCIPA